MDLSELIEAAMRERAVIGTCPLKHVCPHANGQGGGCLIAKSMGETYEALGLGGWDRGVAESGCTSCQVRR